MRNRLDQQKRQHRERGQLVNRQKLGLLEKHKDYVKRAKDYHSKEDRIKKLRQKAAERNKDEFYFGMVNSRTKKGIHIQDRGNEAMPVDVVKLLKTQDAGYVRTLVNTEEKLIQRLKDELGATVAFEEEDNDDGNDMLDSEDEDEQNDLGEGTSKAAILSLLGSSGVKGKKTIFVDTAREVAKFKPQKLATRLFSSMTNSSASSSTAKGKGKAVEDPLTTPESTAAAIKAERKAYLASKAAELSARLERLSTLQRTYREMQVQRAIMGKGAKMVVGGKKGGLSAEEARLNEDDLDELELRQLNGNRKKLPKPEQGIRTGARVWRWKAERHR